MNRPIHRRDSRANPPAQDAPNAKREFSKPNMSAIPRPAIALRGIQAPYNFVPLADWVYFPPWSASASHDLPFSDGIGGTLEFTLYTESPLLVAHEEEVGEKRFIIAPDGRPMIPGSSLRGMIRNVLEIATFGKMHLIDDRHLGIRDLSGGMPAYAKAMTEKVGRAYRARAETGWLRFEQGVWKVYPCRHSRIEHDDLMTLLSPDAGREFKDFVLGKLDDSQRSAQAKYRKWEELGGKPDIRFEPGPLRDHPHSRGNLLRYSKATQIGQGRRKGRLVLTGQPSPRKHMEFLFYHTEQHPIEPSKEVMRGFLKIHEDSKDWEYWKQRHWQSGDAIPVFFIYEGDRIASLGLAQMFKLPYKLSIHDALRNSSEDHCEQGRLDFVETLFGCTQAEAQGRRGLKSRVSFGAAFSEDARFGDSVTVILNSPKPSYYPNYIRQATAANGMQLDPEAQGYTTLMDEFAELRGWKRYPGKPFHPPRCLQPSKVTSTLHPLKTGATFKGKLRFHNLKPEELGGLVWALTWNGDRNLVHQLGTGKPLGFGQVRLELDRVKLQGNDPGLPTEPAGRVLQQCGLMFCATMEQACRDQEPGGWRNSRQITTLLAMADPSIGEGRHLNQMVLDHQTRRNDFVEAKKRENFYVLEDYEP